MAGASGLPHHGSIRRSGIPSKRHRCRAASSRMIERRRAQEGPLRVLPPDSPSRPPRGGAGVTRVRLSETAAYLGISRVLSWRRARITSEPTPQSGKTPRLCDGFRISASGLRYTRPIHRYAPRRGNRRTLVVFRYSDADCSDGSFGYASVPPPGRPRRLPNTHPLDAGSRPLPKRSGNRRTRLPRRCEEPGRCAYSSPRTGHSNRSPPTMIASETKSSTMPKRTIAVSGTRPVP
jgi:hypothetical protein